MKLLGHIAMVLCGAALAGCGVEGSAADEVGSTESVGSESSAIICPELVPPGDGFCPNGTIVPVYEGKCVVGFKCEVSTTALSITTCPQLVPPSDNFCPNGTIVPVYEGKCIVAYSCI